MGVNMIKFPDDYFALVSKLCAKQTLGDGPGANNHELLLNDTCTYSGTRALFNHRIQHKIAIQKQQRCIHVRVRNIHRHDINGLHNVSKIKPM